MTRGSNPIWFEVDLTAHAFDDTFYLFILENEIPYIPEIVWQDPFGNIPWSNPIRFLANGTLPNNIYYDPDTVYRLEFRQGPTQADPLIYLVENYVPGSSGDTPVDETTFSTDNQITNPQFALINFLSPLTLTSISSQVINVAPGWFLNLTGTGTVTLTQVLLNSSLIDPTNASYALQIQLSGSWTNAYLSQRFEQNGVLWSNTFVSSSITALSGNAPQSISSVLKDSQGATLTSVLDTTSLTETFNEYRGVGKIDSSTNTDFPPDAYIEYQLLLPNNANITLTSVQLIAGDVQITYPYEQSTIDRQIDQTYHTAFPVVPVGTVIDYYGFGSPLHYLYCDGQPISRQTYSQLFRALTQLETVTLTSGLSTITVADGNLYAAGSPIEGTGIQAGTLINSISGNVVTMSLTANASGAHSLRFFCVSNGDGSTTFNKPELRGQVLAGNGTPTFGAILPTNGTGSKGGAATVSLTANNLPAHAHNPLAPGTAFVEVVGSGGGGSVVGSGDTLLGAATTGANTTTHDDVNILQPTCLAGKWIRYE